MNGMGYNGKTAPHRVGVLSWRPAARLRRRRAEKQRHVILGLLSLGLAAVAAASFEPTDGALIETVRQAFQQARDSYVHTLSMLAPPVPDRAVPLHEPLPVHAGTPPFGLRIATAVPVVGYGPIVLGSTAIQERQRPESQPTPAEQPGGHIPGDAGYARATSANPSKVSAWSRGRELDTSVRKVEMAAFEMSATRRTLDAAYLLKSADSDVWTAPLDAYDAFETALLNDPFVTHPRRPLVPEPPERFAVRREDDDPGSAEMRPGTADNGNGMERTATVAGSARERGSAADSTSSDAPAAVSVSRVQPQAAKSVDQDDTRPLSESVLTTRAENVRSGDPARASDGATAEDMSMDMPVSAPEQAPERALSSESEAPVPERPEFEQPVSEPADTPRPDAGSPDMPQPDFERHERTRPGTETPHPEMPAVDHTEIALPDIGSLEPGGPEIDLPEVTGPDIERPVRAQPELETPDVIRSGTARPEIASPDIEHPESDRPGIDLPVVTRPDTARPDIGHSDIGLPEVPRADIERPQIDRPVAERPDAAAADIERPAPELPEIARPDIERPQLDQPAVERPDISRPDIERPAAERPGIELPELLRPDIERPVLERPDIERPGVERPELERPDLERPDLERPDLERPDLERPDVERPDVERPDVERPAVERPGIDLPLIERPNS